MFDDLAHKKVLRNDEEIHDGKGFEVVIHQEQVGIVACRKALAFHLVRAISNLHAESALLAFQFEFLFACRAEEIGKRAVVWKARHLRGAAVRAIGPRAHPGFGPCAGILRTAGVDRPGFVKAEFHRIVSIKALGSTLSEKTEIPFVVPTHQFLLGWALRVPGKL